MNPYEHGECYVTDDGAETDLDLGHYERFLNVRTSQANNVTTGRVYHNVITAERRGDFLGKTVQVVPHITDELKRNILLLGQTGDYDIVITEIGGCVGDIESLPFLEAVRQVKFEMESQDTLVIHLTLIPYLNSAGELKTKPTQHSVRMLQESGIQPDILVCRSEHPLPYDIRKKIALFCNVQVNSVIEAMDADTIYAVPLLMLKERLDQRALYMLDIYNDKDVDLDSWKTFLSRLKNPVDSVRIGLVGKYVELHDAYKSIVESFIHSGAANECKVNIEWIHSESLTAENAVEKLENLDGVLVAPGFGERGIEGKIAAIQYVRENNIPFFGICLGMQMAVIEYARNVIGWENAHSVEMDTTTDHPVIHLMKDQKDVSNKGGTMRLGAYPCRIKKDSLAHKIYGKTNISERHRHRYEFNNKYLKEFEEKGLVATGINPDNNLVEMVELPGHPFYIGVQFHPELKSTVMNPHPIFVNFVSAALAYSLEKRSVESLNPVSH
jgi:CTP synthase